MVDRYTKAMLTIIALALVALVTQNAAPALHAQPADIQRVQICDENHCASVSPYFTGGNFNPNYALCALSVTPVR